MGAARLGFANSVRKKVQIMRDLLPKGKAKRDELRRSLHALGMGARSLHIEALAQAVADTVGRLDRLPADAELSTRELDTIDRNLRSLSELAFGAQETSDRAILLVGEPCTDPRFLAAYGKNRASNLTELIAAAPDFHAVILDADAPNAVDIAEGFADEIGDAVPAIVVGNFMHQADAAPYIALGFQYILPRPVTFEQIELVLTEAIRPPTEEAVLGEDFGSMSVRELAARLGSQLEMELSGPHATNASESPIALGRAVEIQAAMWGAIARIREIVTARSRGAVAFKPTGMLGTTHLAPSLDLERGKNTRRNDAFRACAGDVSLKGRRILVVDDDPGVTWFIADLLRAQGCLVDEALDGESALLRSYAQAPELILSDILMPKMDGLQLCHAVRRDPVLERTPFVFLSWKDDLMQRVRELRYEANGFIRKEADVRAIVARVQEALFARARLEARIAAGEAVRGRLDGFTPYVLIDIVSRARPDANVSVREGAFSYEVAIRNGEPTSVVRTNGQGEVLRGIEALALLLGVTSGRFAVEDTSDAITSDLEASYREIAMMLIAEARATSRALWSERMLNIGRIEWNEPRLRECLVAMPDEYKRMADQLQRGITPRMLLETGNVESRSLESFLLFVARRGAVSRVEAESGQELSIRIELPAFEHESRVTAPVAPIDQSSSVTEISGEAAPMADAQDAAIASAAESEDASEEDMDARRRTPALSRVDLALRVDVTDVNHTAYGMAEDVPMGDEEAERVPTKVDHTLYGGRLLDLASPATVLTPRGPVAFTPTSTSAKITTPSPAYLSQSDVLSAPQSFPSIPVIPEKSDGLLEQAMRSTATRDAHVSIPETRSQMRKWMPIIVFSASVLVGTGLVRSLSSESTPPTSAAVDAPLPVGVDLTSSEGALQIDNDAPVRIDGAEKAHAPNATLVLPVGTHTLSSPGITRTVEVKPLRLTKVRLRSTP